MPRKKFKIGKKSNKMRGPGAIKLIGGVFGGYSGKLGYPDLINAESALGKTLFGPIPEGHDREFFQQKKNVWLWYEGYMGLDGIRHEITVSYEVKPDGVYKYIPGGTYEKLGGIELDNFCNAVRQYHNLVKSRLYC